VLIKIINIQKLNFKKSDVSLCINVAKEVPKIIEY